MTTTAAPSLRLVSLYTDWLDEPSANGKRAVRTIDPTNKVGTGWRTFVDLGPNGRKGVHTLYYFPALTTLQQVPAERVEKARVEPLRPRKLAASILEQVAVYRRNGLSYDRRTTKRVLEALRARRDAIAEAVAPVDTSEQEAKKRAAAVRRIIVEEIATRVERIGNAASAPRRQPQVGGPKEPNLANVKPADLSKPLHWAAVAGALKRAGYQCANMHKLGGGKYWVDQGWWVASHARGVRVQHATEARGEGGEDWAAAYATVLRHAGYTVSAVERSDDGYACIYVSK